MQLELAPKFKKFSAAQKKRQYYFSLQRLALNTSLVFGGAPQKVCVPKIGFRQKILIKKTFDFNIKFFFKKSILGACVWVGSSGAEKNTL